MKKDKRIFVKAVSLLSAVVMMSSVFAGCAKDTSDKDEQGRTIISVGGAPSTPGLQGDTFTPRKDAFEKNNPDVVIEPDTWVYNLKTFYAKAAGGQLPTVFDSAFTEIPQVVDAGYAADLTEVLKKRGYDGMFNEKIIETVTRDGKIYSMPRNAYVLGLACNIELFEKAGLLESDGTPKQPKNWDEVTEFAVKIKETTGVPGLVLTTANNAGGWIFTNIAWSFGTDFMEKDKDGKWKATFDSKECAEALQWVKDLKWKYDVLPSNTLIDNGEVRKVFGTESAAMFISAGNIPPLCVQYGMDVDKIGMMALPAGPKRHVTLFGGGVSFVSEGATEDQIDACVRWYESLYNYKVTDEYKKNKENEMKRQLDEGQLIGIKGMSVWSSKSETNRFENELIDKYANSNPNHVRLYNEFVANCPAEIQAEEPVCAQELYAILDSCIQAVLTNKNANPAEILKKANADFQANYLDNLTY